MEIIENHFSLAQSPHKSNRNQIDTWIKTQNEYQPYLLYDKAYSFLCKPNSFLNYAFRTNASCVTREFTVDCVEMFPWHYDTCSISIKIIYNHRLGIANAYFKFKSYISAGFLDAFLFLFETYIHCTNVIHIYIYIYIYGRTHTNHLPVWIFKSPHNRNRIAKSMQFNSIIVQLWL